MQQYSSKTTSINKIAKIYKIATKYGYIVKNDYILDYGCGKYLQHAQNYAIDNGFLVIGYDPYNQHEHVNTMNMEHTTMQHVTGIVCNNVLNVLTDSDMEPVLEHLQDLSTDYALTIMFSVYEGDRTGNGRATGKDQYQRNDKLAEYVRIISLYFTHVSVKHGIIKAAM